MGVMKNLTTKNSEKMSQSNNFFFENPNWDGYWSDFDFLKNWPNLSGVEKLKKYEKFQGHELNTFLYFKDQKFFNRVARENIQNKKERH